MDEPNRTLLLGNVKPPGQLEVGEPTPKNDQDDLGAEVA